jgi:aerobic-type carbon monoxide dehydrogenase small subunit (CoxS/CutS family)
MSLHGLNVIVNGIPSTVVVEADRLLIDVLREDFGLTGTKEGCGIGVCGLCSVLVDRRLMSACLVLAVCVDGSTIETIEGLSEADGTLSPLQESFIRRGGFQCGICTPGQVVAATALQDEKPDATEAEIREWMTGNLCRCTGYEGILESIVAVTRPNRVE